jgi:hypothetical protein
MKPARWFSLRRALSGITSSAEIRYRSLNDLFVLIPLGFLTSPFLIGLRLASDFGCFPRGMS